MELSVSQPAVYGPASAPQARRLEIRAGSGKGALNSARRANVTVSDSFCSSSRIYGSRASLCNGVELPSSSREVTASRTRSGASRCRRGSREAAFVKAGWNCREVGRFRTFFGEIRHIRLRTGAPLSLRRQNYYCGVGGGGCMLVAPVNALPGGEKADLGNFLVLPGGIDFAPLAQNWSDLVTSSVKSSELLRDRLGESAASIMNRGTELSESVAATFGDVTASSQSQISEALGGEFSVVFGRSAAKSLNRGSRIVDSVVAKSGEVNVVPSSSLPESSQLFSSSSSPVEHLGQSASRLVTSAGALTSQLGSKLGHLTGDVIHLDSHSAGQWLTDIGTAVGGYYDGLGPSAGPISATALAALAGSTVAVVSGRRNSRRAIVEGEDLPLRYDPVAIASFFKRRPVDILVRSTKIMVDCSALTISILFDVSSGKALENERRRAVQLVDLITRLGPTAIKIGQALSIRPDLLPVAYLEELQKLQDRVPPFPNEEAKVLIFEGLGRTAEEVYSELSEFPVAAASLGQVYKGRLRATGEVVAIKVQRPGVLEGISRDLFLLRVAATALQAIPKLETDLIALLDTWALRFFDELDYIQEGKNAEQFTENMKSLANVTVPAVYMEHTSRKVLTTQWVDGEKLSESRSDGLLPLISTALNCYLVQLLESGFLHADPHPGNLLRTPDGRLCVLDFGLMTQVTEDQRYALIEYIAHLVNGDYAKVAQDLVKLGFVPPALEDPEKTVAVVPQLTRVLGQLVQGGGARKINIQQVTDDLANMAKDYVFVLPPYFALILRAFSVLEGIGLEADPDYTIVNECYPYISKRLLTDDRTRAALKDFLYGGKEQLNMKRVEDIVGGFQSFRDVMAPAGNDDRPSQNSKVLDPTAKEALKLVFAPEGSYIQELLLTELVRSVDALSREAVAQLWQLIASTIRIPGLSLPAPLSMPGSWPLPVPGLFFGMTPVARLSEEDEQSLDTVKRIWKLLEPSFIAPSPAELLELVQDTLPLFFDLLPGVTTAVQRFNAMLLQRLTLRFADDLDGTNSVLEWNKDPMASTRHIRPISLFRVQNVRTEEEKTSRSRFEF